MKIDEARNFFIESSLSNISVETKEMLLEVSDEADDALVADVSGKLYDVMERFRPGWFDGVKFLRSVESYTLRSVGKIKNGKYLRSFFIFKEKFNVFKLFYFPPKQM